jgi:GntR family transcriptional repressor for pyruvate dehydrogenase complex
VATQQTTPGAALFQALPRSATLANRVVGQLETMIAQGGLADGSRLPPERDLAEQFGVSRTVIREAVASLSARGLLAVQAGSGTVVQRPDVSSIANLLRLSISIGMPGTNAQAPATRQSRDVARCLAVEAAGLAAERRTDDDLENLTRAARQVIEPSHPVAAADTTAFLRTVAAAAHNDLLVLVLDCVLQLVDPLGEDADTGKQLRAILDSIRKGDVKAARRAMRDIFDEPAAAGRPQSKKAAKTIL